MRQGGDRGKSPNETGTQPNPRTESPDKSLKKAKDVAGQGSAKSREPNPKKVAAGTTKKSRDK